MSMRPRQNGRIFEEIAARFKNIPEEDVINVSPEIGSPILDKLSITREPDLRTLFIELLASAADRRAVPFAHPSFVRVIESLSPDEAKMIAEWKERSPIPCIMIGAKTEDGSNRLVYDPYLEVPDSVSSPDPCGDVCGKSGRPWLGCSPRRQICYVCRCI